MLNLTFERNIFNTSRYQRIVGIDEVGRGCWAGPVAVGAYVVYPSTDEYESVQDSKLVTAQMRQKLYTELSVHEHDVLYAEVNKIDKAGIGKAVESLIYQAIVKYRDGKTLFLIDGQHSANFGVDTLKVIKGDSTYHAIGAASILAKVHRDNLMTNLHDEHPLYRFDKHKGYVTKLHRDAIAQHGICALHRKSFKPIQMYL